MRVREGFLEEIASELNEKGLWNRDLFQGSGGSVLVRIFYSFYIGSFWDCFLNILIALITVDLQCCVNFRCRAKWLSYTYTYIHSIRVCVCVCVYTLSLLRHSYSPSCGKMEPGRDDQSMASRSHERDRFPCKFHFKNKHEDKNWPVSIVSTTVKLYYVFFFFLTTWIHLFHYNVYKHLGKAMNGIEVGHVPREKNGILAWWW